MDLSIAGNLGREFKGRTDALFQQRLMLLQREDRERRERKEEIAEEAAETADFALALVVTAEIEEFQLELDTYDAATISAIQDNADALEAIEAQLKPYLEQAFVLPDGRRVFKTEDGLRVYDENGTLLDDDVIDPSVIDDWRPRWETVKPIIEQRERLLRQREELFDYQEKLDDARERLDSGEITRAEFDELRQSLKGQMPDAVREKIPGMEREKAPAAEISADARLDIGADMMPAMLTPSLGK